MEAKLEYEIDVSQKERSLVSSIDTNRLEEAILKYEKDDGVHDVSRNVKRIFDRFDTVIDR